MPNPRSKVPLLTSRGAAAVLVILAALIAVSLILPSLIEDRLWGDSPSSAQWIYWFQVASGNWTPASPPVSRWAFAVSAVIAVLLNNAMLFVAVGLLWRLVVEWRARMQLSQAFVTRDQMNKQALFSKLDVSDPQMIEKINQAFKEGEQHWRENLIEVFGEQQAGRLLELMNRPI